MKLRVDLNLDEKKTAALAQVDAIAAEGAAARAPMWTIYNEKTALVRDVLRGAAPDDFLLVEAQSKGVTVEELCQTILDKATQAKTETLAFESVRQRVKAQIRTATSEQAIQTELQLFRTCVRFS